MSIPIRNLYYLFLYAWAKFPGGALERVGIDDCPDLPNLFARLLLDGTRQLLRRGLDRGYRSVTEEMAGPRGRLRLDRMVKENTAIRGTAICDFDELTYDVLQNQILKTTLQRLGRCPDVEERLRHELRAVARRLPDVSEIRLSSDAFQRVSVSRNNREYGFLMRLCEFIYRSLMPDEKGGEARFSRILEDEVRMSAVFEEFLRNFYRLEQTKYRVASEAPNWRVHDALPEHMVFLPRMVTDVSLRSPDDTIIIDAKFYRKTLASGQYGQKVRSGHLYQIVTYLRHEQAARPDVPLSGMLLYPDTGQSLRLRYTLLGIPVLVATIDLQKEWTDIATDLLDLLAECSASRRPDLAGQPLFQADALGPS